MDWGVAGRRTLATDLDLGDNGLNFLRLVFATMVIATHSRPLTGAGAELTPWNVSVGGVAVGSFFAVSGFLITRSRLRMSGSTFALRRLARIFPAYWFCSVVTAFGLAALIGLRRGGWSAGEATDYVVSGLAMIGWIPTVGDVLGGAPVDSNMNGSLWTLPYEITCYLGLGLVLALAFVRRRPRLWATVALVLGLVLGVATSIGAGGPSGFIALTTFFAAGAALYTWADDVPLDGRLAAASAVLYVAAFQSDVTVVLGSVPGAYLCLWLGARCPEPFRSVGSKNDISYGVYLFGWPVQQTIVAYGGEDLPIAVFAALAVVATVPLAWASWLLVERPTIELVRRKTSRRRREPSLPVLE